jgi:hypothetical protein
VALDCLPTVYVWHVVRPRPASDTLSIHQTSTQEDIYEKSVSPLVEAALAGYNATVFAYGQTGECLPVFYMYVCPDASERVAAPCRRRLLGWVWVCFTLIALPRASLTHRL